MRRASPPIRENAAYELRFFLRNTQFGSRQLAKQGGKVVEQIRAVLTQIFRARVLASL